MTEVADHERPVDLPDVPEGEEISPADAAGRADVDPAGGVELGPPRDLEESFTFRAVGPVAAIGLT
jgi:hypothetical protein